MRIVFLANPRSGRGVSRWARRVFPEALRGAGHEVTEVAVGEPPERLQSALAGAKALVIAGGDGTVHRAAHDAIASGVPLYHVPCGNENLFSRQFFMDRSPATLLDALRRYSVLRVDAAWVRNGGSSEGGAADDPCAVLSLLMCSVGPDAGVIRRLTELRTRAIGHLAYVEPMVREFLAPSFPALDVEVDGEKLLDGERGTLIIANSRQYALRIDPARRADMTDGLLDVVFLPGNTTWSMVRWGLRCRWGRSIERHGAVYRTARTVRITTSTPAPYQIDGDSPGWRGAGLSDCPPEYGPLALRIEVWPGALPILMPSRATS